MTPIEATHVASTADRLFFERNPGRQFRVRPAFENEPPIASDGSARQHYVVVRQIAPGLRIRTGFYATRLVRDCEATARAMCTELVGDAE